MSEYIQTKKNEGTDYWRAFEFGPWVAAFLNHSDRFDIANLCEFERHNETDEVFGLINGDAYLLVGGSGSEPGEDIEIAKMEIGTMYNVPKGVWHHIVVSEDASTYIVECSNTSKENSEKKPITKKAAEYIKSVVKL